MINVLEYSGDAPFTSSLEDMGFDNLKLIVSTTPSPQEFQKISDALSIPQEYLEQASDPKERPRLTDVGHFTSLVFKAPAKKKDKLRTYSFAAFLSEKLLLIITRRELEGINSFMGMNPELLQKFFDKGTTFVLYQLLEKIMDDYFKVYDELETSINIIEDQMLEAAGTQKLKGVFRIKTGLVYLQKSLSSNRDVVAAIEKGFATHAKEDILPNYRMVYNDIIQLIDMVSTGREIVGGAIEIYMTSVSNSMNKSMKRLTAWTSLVLIPTFITGLYGMNFRHMPEIMWKYGYAFALGLIILSVIALYFIFRKKKYL